MDDGEMTMDGQAPNLQNLIEILKHELALHKQLFDVLKAERALISSARKSAAAVGWKGFPIILELPPPN